MHVSLKVIICDGFHFVENVVRIYFTTWTWRSEAKFKDVSRTSRAAVNASTAATHPPSVAKSSTFHRLPRSSAFKILPREGVEGNMRLLPSIEMVAKLPFSLLWTSLALVATRALPVGSIELKLLTPDDFDSTVAKGVW